ncbi:MAG: thiamine pyrophosphate-dependent enzyme, partial [Nitrosopumilaceae archaeon]|nr:thiamine pyrophosphate-dependent enzyme [Nitrosopumilaceae archaeon]
KPGTVTGIQIDINPEKIGMRYPVEVGLVGDSKRTIKNLLPLIKQKTDKKFLTTLQKNMKEWNKTIEIRSSKKGKSVKPQSFASELSALLDDDAIVSVDSGTITTWAARYINVKKNMKFSLSGTLASMACAVPYSIAAQIGFPKRQSIAFVGDGGMAMLLGEFSTAVKYKLPIKVFVIKNNALNMIRWEQMAFLGNPEYAVEFEPIDFAKIADACGAKGFTIKKDKDVKKTIKQALSHNGPVIVEVYVDPFEAPIPPKVNLEFVQNVVSSFAKGQPNASKIALSLLGGQIKEKIQKKTK